MDRTLVAAWKKEALRRREAEIALDPLFWEWVSSPKDRQTRRTKIFKEELIAKAFHPSRVERWVEAGVEDMMFGQ